MSTRYAVLAACALAFGGFSSTALAFGFGNNDEGCLDSPDPVYSNVQFDVIDITSGTPQLVPVKAVLTQPVERVRKRGRKGCFMLVEDPPAIVILHGSGGMDTRNAFYGQSLQRRFTTLSVEMFKGSVSDISGRPLLPLFNYSYALGALKYLIEADGFIAEDGTIGAEAGAGLNQKVPVDPDAVGCLGLSWGGVICNQLAVERYSQEYGDDLYGTNYRFAAHAANYPVCWARNIDVAPNLGLPPGTDLGLDFGRTFDAELTGEPILIQVGSEDAYDNSGIPEDPLGSGSLPCNALQASLEADEQKLLDVVVFDGGYHAFDRLFAVADVAKDRFARLGVAFLSDDPNDPENWPEVAVIPDQAIANESRKNIFRFFRKNLRN